MTVPRSVADVLADHVTLEVECFDRMYLNVYVPRLQHVNGAVWFFRGHRGHRFASSALMDPISKEFVASIHRFCRDRGVPMIEFAKGQRKDDMALEHLAAFDATEGVLFVGRAQEKTRVFRTEKRRNPVTGASYPWIVSATGIPNHFYFYCVDEDFGPFFLKFCSYFPYNAKLCLLTELRAELLHVTGQIPVRVATVPAHDRIQRAVPGSQRVEPDAQRR
jgi:hypothetical protein